MACWYASAVGRLYSELFQGVPSHLVTWYRMTTLGSTAPVGPGSSHLLVELPPSPQLSKCKLCVLCWFGISIHHELAK